MSHRSWFPSILIGLSLFLGAVFLFVMKPSVSTPPEREAVTAVTEPEYQLAVNSILDTYAENRDAGKTHNALIALRVPKEDLSVHFDLVVAFGKLVTKETKDGEARLAALKAANPWLHL